MYLHLSRSISDGISNEMLRGSQNGIGEICSVAQIVLYSLTNISVQVTYSNDRH